MKRGELVTIAMQGDFGKPRPALVIQADKFDAHATVTVLPVSTTLVEAPLFRVTVRPSESNHLGTTSQIMVDKVMTVRRDKLGSVFGSVGDETMLEVARSLAVFLGIAN